jgi:hypothetical protein
MLLLLTNLTVKDENIVVFLDIVANKDEKLKNEKVKSIHYTKEFLFILDSFLNHNPQTETKGPEIIYISTEKNNKDIRETDPKEEQEYVVKADSDSIDTFNEFYADGSIDAWQNLSNLMCNLVRLEDGRLILLRQSSGYMDKFVKQIRSKNTVRRRGVVSSIRTILFDKEIHWWMVVEVKCLTSMLLPLIVNTPFTEIEKKGMDIVLWIQAENSLKKKDIENSIIKMLLECIILLCQTRSIRDQMRKLKVYPICRNLDYEQDDEDISSTILEIVQLLMRDEEEIERNLPEIKN